MKPGPVTYTRAHDVAEALDALSQHGDDAKIIAGGQSLLPLMNLRLARPTHLVDVNEVVALDGVRHTENGLTIGALTRHLTVEQSDLRGPWAAFNDAMPLVGHHPIRVRGTFGGSISHADPTAELPLLTVTLDGTVTVVSTGGSRFVPAVEFFQGPFESDVQPDEIVTEARFESPPAGAVSAFEEFAERSGDFALASVCVAAAVDDEGVCTWARVGLGAVAGVPLRSRAAESVLVGATLTPEVLATASRAASGDCSPSDDMAASGEFRRELIAMLTDRALHKLRGRLGQQ
jgi:CO/xanthine dehydrogenase FAD-binding subunit